MEYHAIYQILLPDEHRYPVWQFYYDRFPYGEPQNQELPLLGFAKELDGDFDESQIESLIAEAGEKYPTRISKDWDTEQNIYGIVFLMSDLDYGSIGRNVDAAVKLDLKQMKETYRLAKEKGLSSKILAPLAHCINCANRVKNKARKSRSPKPVYPSSVVTDVEIVSSSKPNLQPKSKPKSTPTQSKKTRNREPGIYDVAVGEYLGVLESAINAVRGLEYGVNEKEFPSGVIELIKGLDEMEGGGKDKYGRLLDMLKQKNLVAYLKTNNARFKEVDIDSIKQGVKRAFKDNNYKQKCEEIKKSIVASPPPRENECYDKRGLDEDTGLRDDIKTVDKYGEEFEQILEDYLQSLVYQELTGEITREDFIARVYALTPGAVAKHLKENVERCKDRGITSLAGWISRSSAWKNRAIILNADDYGIRIKGNGRDKNSGRDTDYDTNYDAE